MREKLQLVFLGILILVWLSSIGVLAAALLGVFSPTAGFISGLMAIAGILSVIALTAN